MLDWYNWIELPFPFFLLLAVILFLILKKRVELGIIALFVSEMILRDAFYIKIISKIIGKTIALDFVFILVFLLIFLINIDKYRSFFTLNINLWHIIFFVSILFSLLYGVIQFNFAAVLDSNAILLSFSFVLYIVSFQWSFEKIHKIFQILDSFAIYLIVIASIKYLSLASSSYLKYLDLRVIDRNGIMLWVLIFTFRIVTITLRKDKLNFKYYLSTIIISLFIVFSSLRQAWITITLVILLMAIYFPKKFLLNVRTWAIVSLGFFIVFSSMQVFPQIEVAIDTARTAFDDTIIPIGSGFAISKRSTFAFREDISQSYLDEITNESFFTGKGFGDRPIINTYSAGIITVGLHNQYVYFLYYSGIMGLISFIAVNLSALIKFYSYRKTISINSINNVGITLFISMLYYIPANYSNTFDYVYPMVFAFSFIYLNLLKRDKEVDY